MNATVNASKWNRFYVSGVYRNSPEMESKSMNVLVIGSGGREHAIVWALKQSPLNPTVYTAPGNPGTSQLGTNVALSLGDVHKAIQFARKSNIDLTIIGPEQPLVDGWVDAFQGAGLKVFGPTASAAQLEGSKIFAKDFMERHDIPTAAHQSFEASQLDQAIAYVKKQGAPLVIKADGLAAGKGVLMCMTEEEAVNGLQSMVVDHQFGEAGASVVIEEFMHGEEVSVFAVTDGERFVLLAPAQDHKRIGEGDTGLNTGGMGAYAPAPLVTPELMRRIKGEIIEPTLKGMAVEGMPYQGVLYAGLMITSNGPKVVEFNCRFGDPEAQVILPLLQYDLLSLILDLLEGRDIDQRELIPSTSAACVIMASGGYPENYNKGYPIEGIDEAQRQGDVLVFQAGTTMSEKGVLVTNGGRVLGVTALGSQLGEAIEKAYHNLSMIHFEGRQYRRDIGQKGLRRLEKESGLG